METRRSHNVVSVSYLQEVTVVALCIMMLPLFCLAAVGFAGNENAAIQSAVAPAAAVQAGEPIGSGNGLIHVIPSLSSPSVKNGGQLKIQALVKAVEGIARVEAVIEPTLHEEGRDADKAAQPIDTIVLQPAPINLGGVSADGTVGLWQAEWDAHGLRDGYYTVALRITDRTGNVFTDRSLRFSDPIAGNNTPGSPACPPTRRDSVRLNMGDDLLRCAVIDSTNGYAYFGTGTSPGQVVKVALGDSVTSPTRVGALELNAGEDRLGSAVIDSTNGYAYFGTHYNDPGQVVKVALGTGASPPSRVGAVTLNAGEGKLSSAVIDAGAGYAYFGTYTSPGRVVKVALGAGANPPSRVGAVTLNAGENSLWSAVIDPSGGYAYFGTRTSPGRVVKVALGAGANPPSRVGAVELNPEENYIQSAVIDPAASYAYFGTGLTYPWRVVKVALGTGANPPSRVAAVELNERECGLGSAVIDPSAGYAYFGTESWMGIARVVKVALGTGSNTPSRVGAVELNEGEGWLRSAVIDAPRGYAYFGTYWEVVKVALGAGANPPSRVGAVTLNTGENYLTSAVIDPATGYAYFGTATDPGKVVKVGLGSGSNPPYRVGAVALDLGEIVFDFILDSGFWIYSYEEVIGYTRPGGHSGPDYLSLTSSTNTNTFGYWNSYAPSLSAYADYLYRARFNVSTDITDRAVVPQIRLRANSLNIKQFQQYDVLSIDSAGQGESSPTVGGTDYDLYFVPPSNASDLLFAFDLLNFNPEDAAVAELMLHTVTVDRFLLSERPTPTVVQDYTFDVSREGWTWGYAPIFFTPPLHIRMDGALQLWATTNTDTFGYWGSDPADITIEADRLYCGIFEVRTDITDPRLVPEMRLRLNAGNFQASQTFGITSAGDGANSPGTTNTTYDRLYFLPPANCVGGSLIVSFDILNFNPGDAPTASLILDRVTIETLLPPPAP